MAQPTPDGRARRYEHRRGELLDAVVAYVLRHGVTELSMRPLAEAVGVSHVTLRHHFGSKEDLVAEVLSEVRRRTPIAEAATLDPVDLLDALWRGWAAPEGRLAFRLLFEVYGQALIHPERYGRVLDHVVADWLEVIQRLAIASGCPERQAAPFATLLLAQMRGLQLDLLATGDRRRVDAAFALVLDGLRERVAEWTA